MLELPYCDTDCFQIFLNEFSVQNPTELKVMVLDNGAFHKAKRLKIPANIILIFLPPYSPELNPAEKVWWVLKQYFVIKTFKTLEELQEQLAITIKKEITIERILKLCSFEYFSTAF